MEKIFANDMTGKPSISKIYRQLTELSIEKRAQLKCGQKSQIDISPKRIQRWPTDTCSTL